MPNKIRQDLDSGADQFTSVLSAVSALNNIINLGKNSLSDTPNINLHTFLAGQPQSLGALAEAIFSRLLAAAPDRGQVVAALKAAHNALQANRREDQPSQEKASNREATLRTKQILGDRAFADRGTDGAHQGFASPLSPIFLWELSQAPILPFLSLTPDLSRVVAALRSIHNGLQVNGRESRASYETTHRQFHKLETTLREQQIAVDHLLGYRATGGEPRKPVLHALQQTLFLQCPQWGKTAGRFRCVNRTGKAALVHIRPRRSQDTEGGLPDEAIVTFRPNGRRLAPEEAGIFCATVDLSGCQTVSAGRLETLADVYVGGELTLKLFICIEIYDERS